MSRTSIQIAATPERVFEFLDDPYSYDHWVVGCHDIRSVEAGWPKPGTAFHHSVGMWPVTVKDSTTVVERDRPRHLVLRARARPAGVARVRFTVAARGPGTEVTIDETPVEGIAARLHNPLQDRIIHRRNVESLQRLKRLSEGGSAAPAGSPRSG